MSSITNFKLQSLPMALQRQLIAYVDGNDLVGLGGIDRQFRALTGEAIRNRYSATFYDRDEKEIWRPRQENTMAAIAVTAMLRGPRHFNIVGRQVSEGLSHRASVQDGGVERPLQHYGYATQCTKASQHFLPPPGDLKDQWPLEKWQAFRCEADSAKQDLPPQADARQAMINNPYVKDFVQSALRSHQDLEALTMLQHPDIRRHLEQHLPDMWGAILDAMLHHCPRTAAFLIAQPQIMKWVWQEPGSATLLSVALIFAPHLASALLDAGANVASDAHLEEGMTHLIMALLNAPHLVPAMLSKKAKVTGETCRGSTPLMLALELAPEHVPALIEAGASFVGRSKDGATPLLVALAYAPDHVPLILESTTDKSLLAATPREEWTLIMVALQHAPQHIPELLRRGFSLAAASPEERFATLMNALIYAPEHVSALLAAGANVDGVRKSDGYTALMFAVRYVPECVPELIARGARFSADGYSDSIIKLVDHDRECPPLTVETLRLIPASELCAGTPERNAMTVAKARGRMEDYQALYTAITETW